MTSELRPAVEVWDLLWDAFTGTPPQSGNPNAPFEAAAAVIEADREAVRAEMRQALIATGEAAAAHLKEAAKFKALAETLAGALEQMHRAVCHETGFAEAVRADSGLAYPWEPLDVAADASLKALRQYKEATQ